MDFCGDLDGFANAGRDLTATEVAHWGNSDVGEMALPVSQVLEHESLSQMFCSAFINTRKRQQVVMPWESDLAKKIFKRDNLLPKPLQGLSSSWVPWEPPESHDAAQSFEMDDQKFHLDDAPIFTKSLMAISDRTFMEQREELLNDAVEKWLSILRLHPEASGTGRLLWQGGSASLDKSGARRTIEATIGVRSKSTALSRANAFLRFIHVRESEGNKPDHAEVTEEDVWQYFCYLQDTKSAPTRAQSLVSALNYMRHVFGYESFRQACESRRLIGMADVLFSSKEPLRQARVLTVEEVAWLHSKLVSKDAHPTDRAIVGYLLTAHYGRCRHSDLSNVTRVVPDFDKNGGFIEIQTQTHKTAKTASNKTVLLPIVVPVIGVTGDLWVQQAIEAFSAVGLGFTGEVNGPLYRPPARDGFELNCKRGITSAEVTKFLRACFDAEHTDMRRGRISSHSLKATTLSWTAKACVGPADQAVLGRHCSAYTETSAVYSRDNSIRVVAQLQGVIHAIHEKKFLPDCERCSYFPRTSETSGGPSAVSGQAAKSEEDSWSLVGKSEGSQGPPVVDLEVEVLEQSGDETSSSEEEAESEEEEPTPPKSMRHFLSAETATLFVKHRVSKLVHLRDGERGKPCKTLSCGRPLNGNYQTVSEFGTFDLCKRCRINAEKDGILKQA